MESSTSKIMINSLIVIAILLIGVSVTSVLVTKPEQKELAVTDTQNTTQELVTESTTTSETTGDQVSTSSTTEEIKNPITEKKWMWVKTTSGTTTTTTPKNEGMFTVTLTSTGSIQGTTDCNNFLGMYTLEGSKLSFTQFGATKKFCKDSQEMDFMNTLQKTQSFVINKESILTITTASGTMEFK